MYLAISLALVAMVILVFWLIWKLRKAEKRAEYWIMRANDEGKDAAYWRAMNGCCMQEVSDLRKQAEAFEQAAKTMEEHLAAERGRADRLAEALRMSAAARCELKQKLEKAQEESRKRSKVETQLQRELLNLFRYDGTAQSQEELTDE